MKNRWVVLAIAVLVSALILGAAYATAQESPHQHMQMSAQENPHQHMQMRKQLKVGKTGEITFGQETKIGDVVLPAGAYRFAHRTSGDDHFVKFTEMKGKAQDSSEIKCQIEPLPQKVSRTAVMTTDEGGVRRITRIEVAGENVAHVF